MTPDSLEDEHHQNAESRKRRMLEEAPLLPLYDEEEQESRLANNLFWKSYPRERIELVDCRPSLLSPAEHDSQPEHSAVVSPPPQ